MTKFKLFTLPFLMLVFLSVLITSCSKEKGDPTIEGLWTASSLMADGEELIGVYITTFYLDFGTLNGTGGSLNFSSTQLNGDSDSSTGTYVINESTKIVSITMDGDTSDLIYTIDDNTLTLSGTDSDGVVTVIVATK